MWTNPVGAGLASTPQKHRICFGIKSCWARLGTCATVKAKKLAATKKLKQSKIATGCSLDVKLITCVAIFELVKNATSSNNLRHMAQMSTIMITSCATTARNCRSRR